MNCLLVQILNTNADVTAAALAGWAVGFLCPKFIIGKEAYQLWFNVSIINKQRCQTERNYQFFQLNLLKFKFIFLLIFKIIKEIFLLIFRFKIMDNFVDNHNSGSNITNIIGKNDSLTKDNDLDENMSTLTNRFFNTSLDSGTGMAQISNCSKDSIVKPIRPQPLMPMAFSYDSGFEVSPFFNYTFQYEDSNSMLPADTENDDDDIEGFDEELISINHQFTPINTNHSTPIKPITNISSELSSDTNNFQSAFNLALLRRENIRLNQPQTETLEINNNDLDFPDQYELNDLDDDVFHNPSSCPENDNVDIRAHLYNCHRPSCPLKCENEDLNSKHSSSTTSSGSGRSSEPIPIPKGRRLFNETADMLDSSDCFSIKDLLFSLPEAGNRMPYYHPLAPPLRPNLLPDDEVNNNDHQPLEATIGNRRNSGSRINRPIFGSGFQISYSMISDGILMNRFSPPLTNRFNSRWLTGSRNFLFRYGGLSPPNLFGVAPSVSYRAGQFSNNIGENYFPAPYQRRLLTPLYEEPYNDNHIDDNEVQDPDQDQDHDTDPGPSINLPNDVEQNCQSSGKCIIVFFHYYFSFTIFFIGRGFFCMFV